MNYETIKSFILAVLVGISFLLTFILLSYQPNYEKSNDRSYITEVDVGGTEKQKADLIEPRSVIFHYDSHLYGFTNPLDKQTFYKKMRGWSIDQVKFADNNKRLEAEEYVEVILPSALPVTILSTILTFNEEVVLPNWLFERVFLIVKDNVLEVHILSTNTEEKIVATIQKQEAIDEVLTSLSDQTNKELYEVINAETNPIYIPKEGTKLTKKTLVASMIEPESFINGLFVDPTYVTPNISEAYFTDGQRGMRVIADGLKLEFINPIQSSYSPLSMLELIDKSITNINAHKGWTNTFYFEVVNPSFNKIRYRMHYEGYPIFNRTNLVTIEQEWREQELYQYTRPLLRIGNLLNARETDLMSGEDVIYLLEQDQEFDIENIKDIQMGYTLEYGEDSHTLMLDPCWYILYHGDWFKFDEVAFTQDTRVKGGR